MIKLSTAGEPPKKFSQKSTTNFQLSCTSFPMSVSGSRSSSQRLRSDVDNLITQCANEMWSSWTNSNTALQQRVTETTDAHSKLQSHMSKTMQEIYDQEKHIQALKKAIRDKDAPLKVRLFNQ